MSCNISLDLGERRKLSFEISACDDTPFTIQSAKYEITDKTQTVIAGGNCTITDKTLSIVYDADTKGYYELKFIITIADEIIIERVVILVS